MAFEGTSLALGGSASVVNHEGGPGTSHFEDVRLGRAYRRLFVDNSGHSWDYAVVLDEVSTTSYDLDEVTLLRRATLLAGGATPSSVAIHDMLGDMTGRGSSSTWSRQTQW